jgi:hypothetical protein
LHNYRIVAIRNAPGRLERRVKETGTGHLPERFIARQQRLRGRKHSNQQRRSTQEGNCAGEAGRNLPQQRIEPVLPANSSACEFLLSSIGRLLRKGNAKPKAQVCRSFGRSERADQRLRIAPLGKFSLAPGADLKVRRDLVHRRAGYSAIEVCRELVTEMCAFLHLAPLALVESASIG